MKKLFLFILASLPLLTSAQTYDTIYNRAENCYYTSWYDTCDCFQKGQRFYSIAVYHTSMNPDAFTVYPAYTPSPMEVKGVMLFVSIDIPWARNYYDYRRPEYALLYQYAAAPDSMIFLDSVRWDTLTPKIMKWPNGVDTALRGFSYCYAYEAYFEHPVMVDSTFYVGGTQNSNDQDYIYLPTEYRRMISVPPCGCEGVIDRCWVPNSNNGWYDANPNSYLVGYDGSFGGFLPIVDMYRLDGEAYNPHDGIVEGTGRFPNLSYQTLTAVPRGNNRFLHWNDGDTTNPRTVQLTQDTAFIAYFSSNEQRTVHAVANDNRRGHVDGGGMYYLGEVAELTASPYEPYRFVHWNDGDTANPRQIVVTQDTAFVAYFDACPDTADTVGIHPVAVPDALFALAPNPATGRVKVEIGRSAHSSALTGTSPNLGEEFSLTLRDAAGHEVMRKTLSPNAESVDLDLSNLPAGAYFVTLSTPASSATQRLVVK